MAENQGQKSKPEREVLWSSSSLYEWMEEKMNWLMVPPFLPKETRQHLYGARREMMLAARTLIDKSISRLDEAERRQQSQGPTKIPVD
ncbi:MAG: hypothetical protein M1401_01420 [Chloroflexi bacterium]|nr:hypothetical protein [Chloroflexota bacterium]